MNQDYMKGLREPFAFKDVEWKIQVTTQDKSRGMAVAYIDSRAIQNRLDEVLGAFNWKTTFVAWQSNAQICGLSVYDDERGDWVTKYDGAENTDIEPIKGGLSDSFKRAACVWGIGRYLYEIGGIWVEVEPKGKSGVIKDSQYTKLEAEYNKAVAPMSGSPQSQEKIPSAITPIVTYEYLVQSVKPSGKGSQLLELINAGGGVVSAYIKNSDNAIKAGSKLQNVDIVPKQSSYGQYNLINGYQIAA